jgi:hypothetical protein
VNAGPSILAAHGSRASMRLITAFLLPASTSLSNLILLVAGTALALELFLSPNSGLSCGDPAELTDDPDTEMTFFEVVENIEGAKDDSTVEMLSDERLVDREGPGV